MIVTCERCATQFQLDDTRVPARGVRVRCSRCKNAFRVVPPAQRQAEEVAGPARRAREDGQEEITQDIEDSRGKSGSRAAARRSARPAGEAQRAAAAAPEPGSGGLDTEESDWKFNEDSSGGPVRAAREESKGEPNVARRGQNADDWFSGGGDTPLELDDRPWDASEGVDASSGAGASGAGSSGAGSSGAGASHASETPAVSEPAPEAVAVTVEVAPERREPEGLPPASEAADLFDTLSEPELEPKPEPELLGQPAAGASDELSSDSWDQLFGAALKEAADPEAAPEKKKTKRRLRGPSLSLPSFAGVAERLGRWLGYGAQAIGWVVTTALFGIGLHAGLATPAPVAMAPADLRVGGLELSALEGRFVENAVSGRLFVVSGRVRNPGPESGALQDLEVELLDAAGQPVAADRASLHAPTPQQVLRESPARSFAEQPPSAAPLFAGEERAFEVVFPSLPTEAVAFRVAPSHGGRAAAGPLPEVELPR